RRASGTADRPADRHGSAHDLRSRRQTVHRADGRVRWTAKPWHNQSGSRYFADETSAAGVWLGWQCGVAQTPGRAPARLRGSAPLTGRQAMRSAPAAAVITPNVIQPRNRVDLGLTRSPITFGSPLRSRTIRISGGARIPFTTAARNSIFVASMPAALIAR